MEIPVKFDAISEAPYSSSNKEVFLPFTEDGSNLVNDLLYGKETCYLVTGYRGSGKTSYINLIQEKLAALKSGDRRIVFITINFSSLQSHTHIFRRLIRRLYIELEKQNAPEAAKVAPLFDNTFYEITFKSTNSSNQQKAETGEFDEAGNLTIVALCIITILFGLNFLTKWFEFSVLSSFCGFIIGGLTLFARFQRKSTTESSTHNDESSATRQSLYDDDIADHRFIEILEDLFKTMKLVFVFDEMDKLQDSDLEALLKEMKPYFICG